MNGIALLLIAATIGVEYDWQTTDDGQVEYVLIVEPDFLTSLAEGSEIRSTVPPELESVQRLCIRIAQPAKNGVAPRPTPRKLPSEAFRNSRIGLRGATEPTTIFWKAVAPQPEESQLVRYGWQPTKEGTQEYFVQIDPKLLRTLQPGDEIYTMLSAEAGRTDDFVVFSNSKQLPKVPGRRAASGGPVAGLPAAPGVNPPVGAGFAPAPFAAPPLTSGPAAPPSFGPPMSPASTSPPAFAPPRTFGAINNDPAMDTNPSRVNPATGYEPAPAPYSPATSGFQPPGTGRVNNSGLNNGGLNGPIAPPPDNFRNDNYGGSTGPRNPPLANNDPYRRDLNPPVNPGMNPPQNDLFPSGGFQNNPAGNFRPNAPQPPMNNGQYRAADYPPETNLAGNVNPRPYNENQPPGAPAIDYRPTSNPAGNDNQFASLPTNGNTLRPGTRDDLRTNPLTPAVPAEKPWWPLVFTAFGLFVSIGANLYLGWTAAEFYSRYRLAVERLRTSGRS